MTVETTIQPYQYAFIKRQAEYLANSYASVNDKQTVLTIEAQVKQQISELFIERPAAVTIFLNQLLAGDLTRVKAEKYLQSLKEVVHPFELPSDKQLAKLFKKTKKLTLPDWSELDLREHTYIGWNDPGTQKKFIIAYHEGKLIGVSGSISPTIQKGICPICHATSGVSLFMATVKSSGDGTYTKRGNYICYDSDTCNQHLENPADLALFLEQVKVTK